MPRFEHSLRTSQYTVILEIYIRISTRQWGGRLNCNQILLFYDTTHASTLVTHELEGSYKVLTCSLESLGDWSFGTIAEERWRLQMSFAWMYTGLCKSVLSYGDTIRIPYFIFAIGSIDEAVNKNDTLSYSGCL